MYQEKKALATLYLSIAICRVEPCKRSFPLKKETHLRVILNATKGATKHCWTTD
jgi:hypothetical protein